MKNEMVTKSEVKKMIDEAWTKWDVRDIDQFRDTLLELLMFMTPADPEQKTGNWIDKTIHKTGLIHYIYECNNCGEQMGDKTQYCPRCGSRMENADED